ncbi:MAG: hypothetical protein WCF57_13860 [Pyrinomonadaceae bacterium]
MKRLLRFALVLAAALALVPFLPLYIERTMMRSWLVNPAGTLVEWGWRIRTLSSYWADYAHFSPEQRPALWLAVNIALAFIYATVIAFIVDYLLARRERSVGRFR